MIKIHFTYKHVDKPWGGANNFIRALTHHLIDSGKYRFTDSMEEHSDILFMNELGTGPGGMGSRIPLATVKRLKKQGRKLVVRAVNLQWHAFKLGPRNLLLGWWKDKQTIALLNMADKVIFQSNYQRSFFIKAGFAGKSSVVIHNGAPDHFLSQAWRVTPLVEGQAIRVISSTASPRPTKRHDLVAALSRCEGVEVLHCGAWPKDLDSANVKLLGTLTHKQIIEEMKQCHFFLHPAVKDPCPNSIFEAICGGLPVIYNPGPGSSAEIVGKCGIAVDEKNPSLTVAKAKAQYQNLKETVRDNRQYYSIGTASSRYIQVFENIL